MFRFTRPVLSAIRPIKISTGITGLASHPDPIPALKATLSSTLTQLNSLPPTSVYRQATEAITQHRLKTVESAADDIGEVEESLGNMIEVLIEEAKAEQKLVGNMLEWKAWGPLETTPSPNQWRYFDPANPDEL